MLGDPGESRCVALPVKSRPRHAIEVASLIATLSRNLIMFRTPYLGKQITPGGRWDGACFFQTFSSDWLGSRTMLAHSRS